MFSSVKQTVKSLSKVAGVRKTEKRFKMADLAAVREEMFPKFFNIGPRSKQPENEYEMMDFKANEFYRVECQDYDDFYALGEGFTLLASPLCPQLVEIEV